ncbi:SDR family NAD(P)-dependent oxidoreductase [Paraburkholderia terrae]|uniref:SDR family NAD(P)-dependent oxidoreductase n=1 Tax=Paraburkholderia terrae TaxID=311230 RepID=UPI00296AA875|nr:SDR family NAD(P)-dependent oxidoreductase [Paraburkholderia terrae]MDW3658550.1 SDR family NAD(P)-dependent oxidoreductase [Paraburkholderia terrae]
MIIRGKVAVVTGSTSAIGLAIARKLASEGAGVALNGFGDSTEIEAIRAAMAEQYGVPVEYDGADMSQPEQIARMISYAEEKPGTVDILVNNAGIQHVSPVDEFPVARFTETVSEAVQSWYPECHAFHNECLHEGQARRNVVPSQARTLHLRDKGGSTQPVARYEMN